MNTIMFDLDGTLLPMDLMGFLDTYEKAFKGRMAQAGFEPELIWQGFFAALRSILSNDGVLTNEEMFYKTLESTLEQDCHKIKREIAKFYRKDFAITQLNTQPTPYAEKVIAMLKEKGYTLVLATNPVFPKEATEQRIRWAGLEPEDFAIVTTYENTCYTKPKLNYYKRILKQLDKEPEDCLMVGNDVDEDMCVMKLGVDVFLIKDCLINRSHSDITDYKQGSWEAFAEYVEDLPYIR